MKQKKLEVKILCQLCGRHNEPLDIHIRSHKHKTAEKLIRDMQDCEPMRQVNP